MVTDETNDIFVSAASAWEITTKHRIGKLPEAEVLALDVTGNIADQGFGELAITVDDAERAGRLRLDTPKAGAHNGFHAARAGLPARRRSNRDS